MATSVSNDRFVAFIERKFADCAVITIHPRPEGDRYGIDFHRTVSCYETLPKGAAASARREIAKLSQVSA